MPLDRRPSSQLAEAPELDIRPLLSTSTLSVRDVRCRGTCRHKSAEECASATYLVFPYRGAFVRHLGGNEVVAETSHVLFFNAYDGYRVSHPVRGGDACLNLTFDESALQELAPPEILQRRAAPAFRNQCLRIDARAQMLVALLGHRLRENSVEWLEAESIALALARRALAPGVSPARARGPARQRLVDRIKLVLASDLSRRWSLAEIARRVGGSAVYLTQVFQKVEGLPLYRYQLGLRLARALDLLARCDDLSTLAADLGFSSHSHFSAAFQRAYGCSPSRFRQSVLGFSSVQS